MSSTSPDIGLLSVEELELERKKKRKEKAKEKELRKLNISLGANTLLSEEERKKKKKEKAKEKKDLKNQKAAQKAALLGANTISSTRPDVPRISEEELELERKKKKLEKAQEKELKKQKAAQKASEAAAAANLKAQQSLKSKPKKKHGRGGDAEKENPQDFIDPETTTGEKKLLSRQMAKKFSSEAVEKSWYAWWEKSGFFKADSNNSSKPPFTIVFPPPNVTGSLHIGHALTAAIQDTVIRWKRMSGYNVCWVPGMDHGGIATQVVVEKKLKKEQKKSRHEIGREKFVSEVWKWKREHEATILKQLRLLGGSLDWSRECFTMDEKRSIAVTEAFIRLYKEGLIYRDLQLVDWDCSLQSAISNEEVHYIHVKGKTPLEDVPGYKNMVVEFGVLTSFAYPLEEKVGEIEEIVVATTRVETMLGDTAIAVNPDDARYTRLHGKFAIHPFNRRRLPIVCDPIVKPEFGTGAVKITPSHDHVDFKVGKAHNLEFINIFTDDGNINRNGGKEFVGMPRFKARVAITDALRSKGLHRGEEPHEMKLERCSRSNDVVETMIKPQWYVSCRDIANEALDAVTHKKIEILPEKYADEWERWLGDVRDWCISRQLCWGHCIPAWYVTLEDDQLKEFGSYKNHWVVARNEKDAEVEANKIFPGKKFQLTQDPDVLDTWFSSGLYPLSVLGWPQETQDLKTFYPTSVLETGIDIFFFWVARMVMLCMKLGGDVPFKKVFLHPIVRDAHGRKMSKSLGNVVDPIDVICGTKLEDLIQKLDQGNLMDSEKKVAKAGLTKDFPNGIDRCGADALRFALISYTTAQSDRINMDILRVVGYQKWCNKMWNAVRFALSKLGDDYTPPTKIEPKTMPFSCQWILSVLNKAIDKTIMSLDRYKFSDASKAVYTWWQDQLCDIFIEVIKPYFVGDEDESAKGHAKDTLWVCLDTGLRLLHPFMPFVTEELWQRLPSPKNLTREISIMISEYPCVVESWQNDRIESDMEGVLAVVKSFRSLRGETKLRRAGYVMSRTAKTANLLSCREMEVSTLANLSSLKVLTESNPAPVECMASAVTQTDETAADIIRCLELEDSSLANLSSSLKVLTESLPAPLECTVAVVTQTDETAPELLTRCAIR